MNKTISIIRIAIISCLFALAMAFLFSQEQDESNIAFILHFFADKALAAALALYATRLYQRWSKIDPWFRACNKMRDEVMNKPNPSQL